jgi:hypothetical protein
MTSLTVSKSSSSAGEAFKTPGTAVRGRDASVFGESFHHDGWVVVLIVVVILVGIMVWWNRKID